MQDKFPRALRSGDTIGLVATSSPGTEESIDLTCRFFEKNGYIVKLGKNLRASCGYLAGCAEDRAADFNAMLSDDNVRGIFSINGGKGANQLLHMLDYDSLSRFPKVIVGVSDPSILLNAIVARTGVVTFHGPTGYDFGVVGLRPYTEEWFWKVITGTWAAPYLMDVEEANVVRSGKARGRAIGGHLGTNVSLIGTPWEPKWDGAILLIEEIFTDWARIEAMITHMYQAGILGRLSGMLVGRCVECPEGNPVDESFEKLISRVAKGSFPIITNLKFGHGREVMTLPLGVELSIDTETLKIEYQCSGVS